MTEVARALADYTTVNLAYVDDQGEPQACAVFFALTPDGSLVFVSARSTRHGRALAADDRVAFTAQAEGQQWTTITGVQGRGICTPLAGAARATAFTTYTERFPFVAADQRLREALARADLWQLRPTWLRLIDNSQGFGHKQEWPAE
ncbi:MAG TPA: pyridoxamine 5'-phosphate oxidase family protein [Pseudonocardia sp.]|nr:pyridoxamine 5'-phosphate oxidase family protein [Pseudonocardia sp.]